MKTVEAYEREWLSRGLVWEVAWYLLMFFHYVCSMLFIVWAQPSLPF